MNTPLTSFLSKHLIKKGTKSDDKPPTNTRIGCKESNIYGGSYYIPDEEYNQFLKLHYIECIKGKRKEYLTEAQLKEKGPLLIDVDFRYDYSVTERIHTREHISDLIELYLEVFKEVFQVDETIKIPFFVFEKKTVNRVEEKQITKDGIHIIVGIQCENHKLQQLIRKLVVEKIADIWADIPIKNTWDEVFDEGISKGHTNFQLYGSMKPNNEPYHLVTVYNGGYDDNTNVIFHKNQPPSDFENEENISKLSVRYRDHLSLLLTDEIDQKIKEMKQEEVTNPAVATIPNYTTACYDPEPNNPTVRIEEILNIRTKEHLEECLTRFIESLELSEYNFRDAYEYTMILPKSYYGEGSFTKWIRVGWALRNISNRLFIVWLAFSAKSPQTNIPLDIISLYDKWCSFDKKDQAGLTIRSIMYWAKTDNFEEYRKINNSSVNSYINRTLEHAVSTTSEDDNKILGFTDYDLATVLYLLFKEEYVCASIRSNIWYKFNGNSWEEIDSGTSLRAAISKELRCLYIKKALELSRFKSTLPPEGDPMKKKVERKIHIIGTITEKFGKTNDKNNIMREARELFYDGDFVNKTDSNPYIICFKNCVVDFKEKRARRGNPEDYLTKSTNIDYRELNQSRDKPIIDEIEDFMCKLFPDKELCRYMWHHLASTLIGTVVNQTLNMYIGIGQNGKSVLVNLMEQVLGQYKGDVPLTLITQSRTKIGGVSPEIIQLKGVRYAVMQEPSKGDRINEGIMKQITGGDAITGRAPYMIEAKSFIPQFKLVVCSNEFMDIKSQDHGTWRRIRVVDFKSLFTENPRSDDPEKPYQFKLDKNIKEKFHQWKEVFAAMLVKIAYETGGEVKDCTEVTKSTLTYQQGQDIVTSYLFERVQSCPKGCITKGQLSADYKEWFAINQGTGKMNGIKDLTTAMDKRYSKNIGGVWKGVRFAPVITGGDEDEEDSENEESACDVNLQEL
jgi:P4 family phage/plasmid primase-like protien